MFVSFRVQMEYQEQQRALPFGIENILREDFPPPSRLCRLPTQLQAPAPREEFQSFLTPQPSLFSLYGCCSICNCLANPVRVYLNSPLEGLQHHHPEGQTLSERQPPRCTVRVPSKLGVQQKQQSVRGIKRESAQALPIQHDTKGIEPTTAETKENPEVKTVVTTKKKRFRSHFSQGQLQYLEAMFSRQQYLSRDERSLLASGLEMTELQIRNWFQNRRYQQRHRQVGVKQVPVRVLVQE